VLLIIRIAEEAVELARVHVGHLADEVLEGEEGVVDVHNGIQQLAWRSLDSH